MTKQQLVDKYLKKHFNRIVREKSNKTIDWQYEANNIPTDLALDKDYVRGRFNSINKKKFVEKEKSWAEAQMDELEEKARKIFNDNLKLRNNYKIVVGKFVSKDYEIKTLKPYLKGDPNNVLVIPDLHLPAIIDGALEFCMAQQEKYNCGKVIFLGDLVDLYNQSRFPKNPDYRLSPLMELEEAKNRLVKWYEVFPNATVLTSNHDSRVFKQAQMAQIPTTWLKDLKDILAVPNWQFTPEYEYNNILYYHGESDTARKVAVHNGKSCIQGHRHSECYIDYVKKGVFGCQAGTLVDRKSMVFDYAKHQLKEWINGCVVVLDQQPIIINYGM